MTIVYAVIFDEEDSYDVGYHDQTLILVKDKETGERIIDGLIGKSKHADSGGGSSWSTFDTLRVEKMEVWG